MLVKPLRLRINRSRSDAAGDENNLQTLQLIHGHFCQFTRLSERADNIFKIIPCLQAVYIFMRADADRLEYDVNGTLYRITVTDCQRDTFTYFVHLRDQKLTGKSTFRHTGSFNNHFIDVAREVSCLQNLKHNVPPDTCALKTNSHSSSVSIPGRAHKLNLLSCNQ